MAWIEVYGVQRSLAFELLNCRMESLKFDNEVNFLNWGRVNSIKFLQV